MQDTYVIKTNNQSKSKRIDYEFTINRLAMKLMSISQSVFYVKSNYSLILIFMLRQLF